MLTITSRWLARLLGRMPFTSTQKSLTETNIYMVARTGK